MTNKYNDFAPFTMEGIWNEFHSKYGSSNKHLLTLYSIAVGVNTQTGLELGIGGSTRALRAAMKITGGVLHSCDIDKERFEYALAQQDDHWKLHLTKSEKFIESVPPPYDFFFHDGAHDFYQVKRDLKMILPRMKCYGLLLVHDTEHSRLGPGISQAINEAVEGKAISLVKLPYSFGLTIIRIEESDHPAIVSPWAKEEDGSTTKPLSTPMKLNKYVNYNNNPMFSREYLKWRFRYLPPTLKKKVKTLFPFLR